jgi:DNA excision repair protein ERCC-4
MPGAQKQNKDKLALTVIAHDLSGKVAVIADYREQHSATCKAFQALPQVDLVLKHLPVGDYIINNQIIFERKTLHDFCASIQDGRLFRQAERLLQCQLRAVIILENSSGDFSPSGMRREAIMGALISCTVIYGLPVIRSFSGQESARVMLHTAQQVSRTVQRAYPRKGHRPRGKRKIQLHILQGLPGVGPVRADRLLNIFKSVKRVMAASYEELAEIKGIGPVLAKKICDVIEHEVC